MKDSSPSLIPNLNGIKFETLQSFLESEAFKILRDAQKNGSEELARKRKTIKDNRPD